MIYGISTILKCIRMHIFMKSYVIPVCALLVGIGAFYIYKQSEHRRQQEIIRVIEEANHSLQRIEARHAQH